MKTQTLPATTRRLPIRFYFLARAMKTIAEHWARLRQIKEAGGKVQFGTLAQKTGMKFGSGTARKFRRAHAAHALKLARVNVR